MPKISKTYKIDLTIGRTMKKHYKSTADGRPLFVEVWTFYAMPSFDREDRFVPPSADLPVGRGDSPLACVTDLLGKIMFFDKTLLELDQDTTFL